MFLLLQDSGLSNAYVLTDAAGCQALASSGLLVLSGQDLRTKLLGAEYSLLLVDVAAGLSPDGVALAAGCLRGGGCLVLLIADFPGWPQAACPDYLRMLPYPLSVGQSSYRWLQRQRAVIDVLLATGCAQQVINLEAVIHWYQRRFDLGKARSVLEASASQHLLLQRLQTHQGTALITGPRGSGKSTLLGWLARRVAATGRPVYLLTGSEAARQAVGASAGQTVSVLALQRLLNGETVLEKNALLLIDESAALPVAAINTLLDSHPQVVMASTTEGYEGSGQALLSRLLHQWRQRRDFLHLMVDHSLRFEAGDAVDSLLTQGFLLNVQTQTTALSEAAWRWQLLRQQDLHADDDLLRQVYGLLREAHYRTTPDDLRVLLDGVDLHCAVLCCGRQILAVCLLLIEGGLDREMQQQIIAGLRRPRGHLLVQSLAVHLARADLLDQRVARIMRIAVHERYRRRGLASACLAQLEQWLCQQGIGWVGSSFSASAEALAFWQAQGYALLRLGERHHPASGERSALVLKQLPL